MGTEDELAATAKAVEELDRRVLTYRADVRRPEEVAAGVAAGLSAFGRLDVVAINAGVIS